MKTILKFAAFAVALGSPSFATDAQDGEKVFKKCKSCHQVGPEAKNKTGPILTGVIGRPAGFVDGYKYSASMRAAGDAGLVWTQDNVFDYVLDPTKFLRAFLDDPKAKAKMTFKLKKEDDRRAVIAYLATFQAASMTPADGFCVLNASGDTHLFATETREGERQLVELEPGASLCATGTTAKDGVISVYEDINGFEGCSRVIATGTTEQMLEYAEFDRCGWSSHHS